MLERLSRLGRSIAYQTLVIAWRVEQQVRSVLLPLKGGSFVFLVFLPILGAGIGEWLYQGLRYSIGDAAALQARVLGDPLVSLGTALASVLAIAFSLSMFLQQSVSDLYSPQYFVGYSFDRKQRIAFALVVSVVMGQLGYGLYLRALGEAPVPLLRLVLIGTFSSTALLFSLLLWQYLHVARKTTPVEAIRFLHAEAVKHLAVFHRGAVRAARLTNLQGGGSQDETLARVYAALLPGSTATLLRPFHALSEITMRLSSRGDQVAARQGLSALTAVLSDYLSYRRTTSIAVKSSTHFFAIESDSQSLLSPILERLNEMGDRFLRSGQVDNARGLVDSYAVLVATAVKLEFINHPSENPIAYQLAYHLKEFVDGAVRQSDNEVPFRAIETFVRIGEYATSRSNATLLYTAAQNLASIGVRGATSQAWFIAEQSCAAQSRLLLSLFQWRGDARSCFDEVLEQLLKVHQAAVVSQAVRPNDSFASTTTLRKPFDDLQQVVVWVRVEYGGRDAVGQRELSRAFQSFVEPFYTRLRSACDTLDLESIYADTLAELIVETVKTLVALEPQDARPGTTDYVTWFIWLPSWFGDRSRATKSPRGLENAVDAACKIALMLIVQDGPFDRVVAAIDTQFGIVKRALERNTGGYGYYEPRLMLRICYCGVVAMKYRQAHVVERVCACITAFEAARSAKLKEAKGAPSLLQEFLRWRDEVEEHQRPMIRDDPDVIAASLVELRHVDEFLAEAWGYEMSGNRWRERALHRVGTRTDVLGRLVVVLKRRVHTLNESARP